MIYKYKTGTALLAVIAMLGPVLSGCGNDDGAHTKPTITAKPDERERDDLVANGVAEDPDAPVAEGFGSLSGVIVLEGDRPSPRLLVREGDDTARDAAVCAARDVPDESLIVGDNGGVQNVFVYLQRAPRGAEVAPVPEEPVIFDQEWCRFIPHGLIVRTGQPVLVLNSDPVLHNTNTHPLRGTGRNLSVQPNEEDGVPLVYDAAETEPVGVTCDVHGWMRAWHLPLDHDFAALTDEEGRFTIENLPAGEHEFRIWHERTGPLERRYRVTIQPDETAEVELSYGGDRFVTAREPETKTLRLSSLR